MTVFHYSDDETNTPEAQPNFGRPDQAVFVHGLDEISEIVAEPNSALAGDFR